MDCIDVHYCAVAGLSCVCYTGLGTIAWYWFYDLSLMTDFRSPSFSWRYMRSCMSTLSALTLVTRSTIARLNFPHFWQIFPAITCVTLYRCLQPQESMTKSFSSCTWKGNTVLLLVSCCDKLEFLPSDVVNATSINAFKNRLDKFWKSQEVIYNITRPTLHHNN